MLKIAIVIRHKSLCTQAQRSFFREPKLARTCCTAFGREYLTGSISVNVEHTVALPRGRYFDQKGRNIDHHPPINIWNSGQVEVHWSSRNVDRTGARYGGRTTTEESGEQRRICHLTAASGIAQIQGQELLEADFEGYSRSKRRRGERYGRQENASVDLQRRRI